MRADAPPAFHLLAKPTGAVCNLDCSYRFFLSKEMLYPGSRFRMADELLETYVRQLIEAHARVPVVQVAWQGGEPTLMGVEFFRRSVDLVAQSLKPGQHAEYTSQTNGTKLDAQWAEFFKANDFLVGISIDGPHELHDTFRVTRGGRGSFDQVMRGLSHLRAADVEFNVLTTVHAAGADAHDGRPARGRSGARRDHAPVRRRRRSPRAKRPMHLRQRTQMEALPWRHGIRCGIGLIETRRSCGCRKRPGPRRSPGYGCRPKKPHRVKASINHDPRDRTGGVGLRRQAPSQAQSQTMGPARSSSWRADS